MQISEDTVLKEDVDGLLLVAAPVKVTIDGAKLGTGLAIAPGAAATITVDKTAKVAAVSVAAADVTVDVAGTVESVNVASSTTGAKLVVEEGATVSNVTDSTGGLEVSGADAGSSNDTVAEPESAPVQPESAPAYPFPSGIKFGTPPIGNWGGENTDPGKPHENAVEITTSTSPDGRNYDVTIKGNVQKHTNGAGSLGKWVGIGIPKQETHIFFVIREVKDCQRQ